MDNDKQLSVQMPELPADAEVAGKSGMTNRAEQPLRLRDRILGPEEWIVDPDELQIGPGPYPGLRRPLMTLWWALNVTLGIGFLFPLLAGLAAIPGLSFLALGIMLSAEGDVGKSGRLRDGFPLLAISTRVATISLMILLFLTPVMLSSSVAEGQQIIARISNLPQRSWAIGTMFLQVLAFVLLLLAIANGGSFGRFFWPFRKRPSQKIGCGFAVVTVLLIALAAAQPAFLVIYLALMLIGAAWRNFADLRRKLRSGEFAAAVNHWSEQLLELFRPWYHFQVAIKAAIGALCWLVIPTLLLGAASSVPQENPVPRSLLSFLGGGLMIPVAAWLPLLQCHQAATGRFKAIFEVRMAREIIRRAPLRWAVATILLYGLAIPLYLSKVVLPPADALWLFTPLFILVIYPTRLLVGWVYGAGMRREQRVTRLIRWPTKVAMIPALGLYSFILFLLPLISEAGPRAMLENHAFLLPVPSGQIGQN